MPFQDWVVQKIRERNEEMTKTANMNITFDSQISQCFANSTAVSRKYPCLPYLSIILVELFLTVCLVKKGISSHLLKIGSKRRRPARIVALEKD